MLLLFTCLLLLNTVRDDSGDGVMSQHTSLKSYSGVIEGRYSEILMVIQAFWVHMNFLHEKYSTVTKVDD